MAWSWRATSRTGPTDPSANRVAATTRSSPRSDSGRVSASTQAKVVFPAPSTAE
ncbi:MAG TPA: hypothetical protein VF517_07005 [Thermoleophilaceae bacterium]